MFYLDPEELIIIDAGPVIIVDTKIKSQKCSESVSDNMGGLIFDEDIRRNVIPLRSNIKSLINENDYDRIKDKKKMYCIYGDINIHNSYYGYIYMIINNETGKKYIGKRKIPVALDRGSKFNGGRYWEEFDEYWGSSISLNREIELKGKENFTKVVLEYITKDDYDNESEAVLLEFLFITLLTLKEPDNYNNVTYFRGIFRDGSKFKFFKNFCAHCYKGILKSEESTTNHVWGSYLCGDCYGLEEAKYLKNNNFINVNKDLATKIYERILFQELKTPSNSIPGDRIYDFFEEFLTYSFINMDTGEIIHDKEAYFEYIQNMLI